MHSYIFVLFFLSATVTCISSDKIYRDEDLTSIFSSYPSLHNGVKMSVRKRDVPESKSESPGNPKFGTEQDNVKVSREGESNKDETSHPKPTPLVPVSPSDLIVNIKESSVSEQSEKKGVVKKNKPEEQSDTQNDEPHNQGDGKDAKPNKQVTDDNGKPHNKVEDTNVKPQTKEGLTGEANVNLTHITTTETKLNATTTGNSTADSSKVDINNPGVIKRGLIVFGGLSLMAVAYFVFYRRKTKKNENLAMNNQDNFQFRYGILNSEDKRDNLELSRMPLTMDSEEEDEDLEIFDLGEKRKSMSYVNLQSDTTSYQAREPEQTYSSKEKESLLLDIDDKCESLINLSSNSPKLI